jgi:3-deoxy-D-arabino-heptulosonate 7-phosphate (DAHP) synthase
LTGDPLPPTATVRADGLPVEVHPKREEATSDGDPSLLFDESGDLMSALKPFVAAAGRTMRPSRALS